MTSIVRAPLRSGRRTMMGGFINWKGFKVSIFYIHNVVGGVVQNLNVIYGGAMQCAVTFWETHNDGWIYKL